MARGGRNGETEKDRMNSMEQYKYSSGRSGSGTVNYEKAGYTQPKARKTPKSAGKP